MKQKKKPNHCANGFPEEENDGFVCRPFSEQTRQGLGLSHSSSISIKRTHSACLFLPSLRAHAYTQTLHVRQQSFYFQRTIKSYNDVGHKFGSCAQCRVKGNKMKMEKFNGRRKWRREETNKPELFRNCSLFQADYLRTILHHLCVSYKDQSNRIIS